MIGEVAFQVTARMEPGGEPVLKVTAIIPYGARTASVTEEMVVS